MAERGLRRRRRSRRLAMFTKSTTAKEHTRAGSRLLAIHRKLGLGDDAELDRALETPATTPPGEPFQTVTTKSSRWGSAVISSRSSFTSMSSPIRSLSAHPFDHLLTGDERRVVWHALGDQVSAQLLNRHPISRHSPRRRVRGFKVIAEHGLVDFPCGRCRTGLRLGRLHRGYPVRGSPQSHHA